MTGVLTQGTVTLLALMMIALGAGGLCFIGVRTARVGFQRRARLSDAGPVGAAQPGPFGALSELQRGVRRLGDKVETRDPNELSSLRNKLMQARFTSREAVAYYLGARSIALVAATVATVLLLPMAFSKSGMLAIVMAAIFALIAILAPD